MENNKQRVPVIVRLISVLVVCTGFYIGYLIIREQMLFSSAYYAETIIVVLSALLIVSLIIYLSFLFYKGREFARLILLLFASFAVVLISLVIGLVYLLDIQGGFKGGTPGAARFVSSGAAIILLSLALIFIYVLKREIVKVYFGIGEPKSK